MKKLLAFAIGIVVMTSCNKNNPEMNLKSDNLIISMGSVCGWCTGGDSLLITEVKTSYQKNTSCSDTHFNIEYPTLQDDWNELISLLDKEEFLKININTCYVCADGCDSWITLNDGAISHTIRYGQNDSLVVQNIQPFIDKLLEIKSDILTD